MPDLLTNPEVFVLSPLEYPLPWLVYVLKWGSCALVAVLASRLWRQSGKKWWLLIGAAFLWEPAVMFWMSAWAGMPPVPLGKRAGNMTMVSTDLTFLHHLIAATALLWAYRTTPASSEADRATTAPPP